VLKLVPKFVKQFDVVMATKSRIGAEQQQLLLRFVHVHVVEKVRIGQRGITLHSKQIILTVSEHGSRSRSGGRCPISRS